MAEQKRGDDAGDHAPKPIEKEDKAHGRKSDKPDATNQDAPNYDKRVDGGRAVATEDVSSANDE